MDELDQFLQTLPEAKRAVARASWAQNKAKGVAFQDWADAVRQKYPLAVTDTLAPAARDVTATRLALPRMVAETSIGAFDPQAPRIPLPAAPGAFQTGAMHAGNAAIPYADELIGAGTEAVNALRQGRLPTSQGYETNRRMAEYRLGQGTNENPTAAGIGTVLGAVAPVVAIPTAAPEILAGRGTGRLIGRAVAEGTGLGALYGSGASDPGLANRIRGGVVGGVEGGLASAILTSAGAISGSRRGTLPGRQFLNVAEAGDVDVGAAQQRVREALPSSPLMAVDVAGPVGPSRIRAASAVPGAGQRIAEEAMTTRTAGRPERAKQFFRNALGVGEQNPYAAAEQQLTQRQQEAEKLFDAALTPQGRPVVLPADRTAPLLKIPLVRQLIDEYRNIVNSGVPDAAARRGVNRGAPGLERVTGPELQYVKRELASRGIGAAPGGAAKTQASGRAARSLQGAVEDVLNAVPGYREANARYATQSGLIEAGELGDQFLQMDPDRLEHTLGGFSPEQIRTAQTRMPGSVAKAVEGGSAQTAMSRLGIGPGARLSRSRAMDAMVPETVRPGFNQFAADERLMTPAEQAQRITSPTQPTRESVTEAALGGLSFGEPGMMRRLLLRSLHGGPNPEALAQDARMLTTGGSNRPALNQLLQQAVEARQGRGQNRLLGLGVGRGVGAGLPTVQRNAVVADRALDTDQEAQAQRYYDDLLQKGVDPQRAEQLTRTVFGL